MPPSSKKGRVSSDRSIAMARAYSRALAELRDRHRDEFSTILERMYASEGLEIEMRPRRRGAAT